MTQLSSVTLDDLVALCAKLGPGARLPAAESLCAEWNISRTTLREAIAVLVYLRVLSVKPKLGTTITTPSTWRLSNHSTLSKIWSIDPSATTSGALL